MARPEQNLLLAKLAANNQARLLPDLELVDLELGQLVYESRKEQSHVYFPTDSVISLLYTTEEGCPPRSRSLATMTCSALYY